MMAQVQITGKKTSLVDPGKPSGGFRERCLTHRLWRSEWVVLLLKPPSSALFVINYLLLWKSLQPFYTVTVSYEPSPLKAM